MPQESVIIVYADPDPSEGGPSLSVVPDEETPRLGLEKQEPSEAYSSQRVGREQMESLVAIPERSLAETSDTLELLGIWKVWLESQYAPNTVRSYWGVAGAFFFRHPIQLEHVTPEHIASYLGEFPMRSSSKRTHYQGLRNLFQWAYRREVIPKDPTLMVLVPKVVEKVPRALTETEYANVLAAAYARNGRRGATLELLYHTGGRIGEILTLRWDEISDEALLLHGHKTGKDREIPMTPGLFEVLRKLHGFFGDQEFVVPRCGATVWGWCREAGREAGVARVHPHLFRSTAATRMLVRGARPHAVKDVLGHASIRTTQAYWAVEKEDKQAAVDLL